jgi:methionyl-tRNA synthetase
MKKKNTSDNNSADRKKFYLTTTLPYVNAKPHIGFALEIVQADAVARYHSLLGEDVFFNFGTDEHGQKIYQKAIAENKDPQKYTDEYAAKFDDLKKALNLSYNNFIRTTDPHHISAAQEMWKRCFNNGFIEKGRYKAKYCVGCELEKQDSELVDGKCPLHPTQKLEIIEEENYFFKFSRFQEKLYDLYNKYPDFVIPAHRLKEITNFVSAGLEDFSVSRLKEKMPWGVPVPGDDKHVMYVWFDALTNYVSALGWPENEQKFKDFWGTFDKPLAIQVAGKDNLRQQSAMWQAMLMAAGLPPTRQIFIHGFIISGGEKMSKSLGNVIDPMEYVENYGTDALRYYLLAKISPSEDSDFTKEKFEEVYNADLANGLGNLVSRSIMLCQKGSGGLVPEIKEKADSHPLRINDKIHSWKNSWRDIDGNIPKFNFNEAIKSVWNHIADVDKYINENEPWKLIGNDREKFNWVMYGVLDSLHQIAWQLQIFMPETSKKIAQALQIKGLLKENPSYKDSWTNLKPGTKINPVPPLFPRTH